MRISNYLRIGLGLLVILLLGQAALTYHYARLNVNLVRDAVERDFDASLHISRIALEGNKMRRYEKEFFIYVGSPSKMDEYVANWEASYDELSSMLKLVLDDGGDRWSRADRNRVSEWQVSLEDYAAGFRAVVGDVRRGRIDNTRDANSAIREAKNRFRVLLSGAAEGGDEKYAHARSQVRRIEHNNRMATLVVGAMVIASVSFALALLLALPGAIRRSMQMLSEAAQEMSRGRIEVVIPVSRTNAEFRPLAETLERMRVSQKVLMDRMRRR